MRFGVVIFKFSLPGNLIDINDFPGITRSGNTIGIFYNKWPYIGCGSLSPFGFYMHAFTRRHENSTEIQRTKAFIEGTYGFLSGNHSPAYVAHATEFAEESICNGTFCEALKRGADGIFLPWVDLLVATRRIELARGV